MTPRERFLKLTAQAKKFMADGQNSAAAHKLRIATDLAWQNSSVSTREYYEALGDLSSCYARMITARNAKRMGAKAGEAMHLAFQVLYEIGKEDEDVGDEFITVALNNGLELLRWKRYTEALWGFEKALSILADLSPPKPKWLGASLYARAAAAAICLNQLDKAKEHVEAGLHHCEDVTVPAMKSDIYLLEAMSALLASAVELSQAELA